MVFEADGAYKKIDAEVEKTLRLAAKALGKLEIQTEITKTRHIVRESVISTTTNTTSPPTIIRTPKDMCSRSETDEVDSLNQLTDSLFPHADYYPAKDWARLQRDRAATSETIATEPRSVVRKQHERLALEPLENCKNLRKHGLKAHTRPDSEFPSASYKEGLKPKVVVSREYAEPPTHSASTTSTTSSGPPTATSVETLVDKPMEFYSKNRRMRMLLEPLSKPAKQNKPVNTKPVTMKPVTLEEDEFPIVPKQLESVTNCEVKVERTKIHAKVPVNGQKVDVLGLFDGSNLRRHKMVKLSINGCEFSS